MVQKNVMIGLGVMVLVIVGVFAFMQMQRLDTTKPVALPPDPPGKMYVTTKDETFIAVNNLFSETNIDQKPVEIVQDAGTNTTTALLARTDEYDVLALEGHGSRSFLISIATENIREARLAAENTLVQKLGVEKAVLCTLPIRVAVARPFEEHLPSNEIGLSFCPGSQSL